jgi:hypothetical protein
MFDCAERPDAAHAAVAVDSRSRHPGNIDGFEPQARSRDRSGSCRSPRLVAALLALVCSSACESTTVPGLNVRAAPTTASPIIGRLATAGTAVAIECFTHGQAIHGQSIWYRISAPHKGYVTAYYVHTDGDTLATTHSC